MIPPKKDTEEVVHDDVAKATNTAEGDDIAKDDSAKSTNDDAKREEARESEVAQDNDDQDGDDDVNAQGTNLTKSSSVGSTGKKQKKRKNVKTIYIHLHLRVPLPRSHHDSFFFVCRKEVQKRLRKTVVQTRLRPRSTLLFIPSYDQYRFASYTSPSTLSPP